MIYKSSILPFLPYHQQWFCIIKSEICVIVCESGVGIVSESRSGLCKFNFSANALTATRSSSVSSPKIHLKYKKINKFKKTTSWILRDY